MNLRSQFYYDYYRDSPSENKILQSITIKYSAKNERKVLQVVLLSYLQKILCDLFGIRIQDEENISMECYVMDSKIMQLLIQGIIETGEYTLEGIAYYTRIPFDVIYEAACGISNQFSITPWARVVDLYMQVKPDIAQVLIDKLLEVKNKNQLAFSSLLNEG